MKDNLTYDKFVHIPCKVLNAPKKSKKSYQTVKGSMAEVFSNLVVGYSVNFMANFLIFPHMGWEISATQNIKMGVMYTCISVVRSFCMRRIYNKFNFFHIKNNETPAHKAPGSQKEGKPVYDHPNKRY